MDIQSYYLIAFLFFFIFVAITLIHVFTEIQKFRHMNICMYNFCTYYMVYQIQILYMVYRTVHNSKINRKVILFFFVLEMSRIFWDNTPGHFMTLYELRYLFIYGK